MERWLTYLIRLLVDAFCVGVRVRKGVYYSCIVSFGLWGSVACTESGTGD